MTQEKPESTTKPKKKKWKIIGNIFFFFFMILLFGGWETLCLQNIPLLLFLLFVSGGILGVIEYSQRRYRSKLKQGLLGMLYLFAFFTSILLVMRFFVPIVAISEKTTYLTEPRTQDGMAIDIRRAIGEKFLPDCSPRDNGFRHVMETLDFDSVMTGVDENQRDAVKQKLYQSLELPEDLKPELTFQPVYGFFEEILKQNLENESPESENPPENEFRRLVCETINTFDVIPWPEEHRDTMEQWLTENEAALNCVAEAVRYPEYFVPYFQNSKNIWMVEYYEDCWYFHREIVRGLTLRIMRSLGKNDREKIFEDIETIARITEKHLSQIQSGSGYFQAIALEEIARHAFLNALRYGQLDLEQLERLEAVYKRFQGDFSLADIALILRLEEMHSFYVIASGDFFDRLSETDADFSSDNSQAEIYFTKLVFAGFRYFGWRSVFAESTAKWNQVEAVLDQPFSRKLLEDLAAVSRQKTSLMDTDTVFMDLIKLILRKGKIRFYPEVFAQVFDRLSRFLGDSYANSRFRLEANRRQMTIVFALERDALDHEGEYPETLEPLLDGYLAEQPTDPFTNGEPFYYKRQETESEKGYILYSVGYNSEDDGGLLGSKCDPETDEETKGDDPNTEVMKKIITIE